MRTLRIAFSDFIFDRNDRDRMASFDPKDNVFTRLLAREYDVRVVPMTEAEVLVYSAFGEAHRAFRGRKVFYTSENVLPDFDACDHAITFSHLPDDPRHYRLPQYVFYVDDARRLVKGAGFDAAASLRAKTKFCNFVVSNPRCPQRNRFFRMLNRRKHVDSGGRHFNNLGRPIADKLAFVRDYKFTLAFENSVSDGYTTEKLVEPMLAGSLPIYWGNPKVALDFNPRSFIDVSVFPDFDAAIDHILTVDADDALYLSYLREPWFNGDTPPSWFDEGEHLAAWRRFLSSPWTERPRVYRDRGLRDHALGTGLGRHISSIGTKLDGVLWKAGWRF
jgi:hypothetical protein